MKKTPTFCRYTFRCCCNKANPRDKSCAIAVLPSPFQVDLMPYSRCCWLQVCEAVAVLNEKQTSIWAVLERSMQSVLPTKKEQFGLITRTLK